MNPARERFNPYKMFGTASGIAFLSFLYLKMNNLDLIFLPLIVIIFFAIVYSMARIVIKLELDSQGFKRIGLKKEYKDMLKSCDVSDYNIKIHISELMSLPNNEGKRYMRDTLESYYSLVNTKKMTMDAWFKKTYKNWLEENLKNYTYESILEFIEDEEAK